MSSNPASGRIPALDGVRGIATLGVLIAHFMFADLFGEQWWWAIVHGGWLGVDLFFVLSGFLITGILLRKKGRPNYFRDFYWRRVLRIFPLYYLAILLSIFAIVVIDQQPHRLYTGYNSLGYFLAFIPNVAMALGNNWVWQTNWVGLSHLWSLAVEEQYYIIWPLIVLLLPRKPLAALCIILVGMGGILRAETAATFGEVGAYVLPWCRMDGLALGSLLAIAKAQKWVSYKSWMKSLASNITFLSFLIVLYYLVAEKSYWRDAFVATMFMGLVYFALAEKSIIRSVCESRFLIHIGGFSYGMYVFHQMFRVVFETVFKAPLVASGLPLAISQLLYIIICTGISYGLARLSFRFIEKPFLDMK